MSFDAKQDIIDRFNRNVKGVPIQLDDQKARHCGKEGHWLEKQMGIAHNASNEPDIHGYEMKKSSPKTTLGDFSASEYAFSQKGKRQTINASNNWTDDIIIKRDEFIKYFGNPNEKKDNRYSWSGSCIPTYNTWNKNGQILLILDTNDIVIYYSYSHDEREVKETFPEYLHTDNVMIAIWKSEKLETHVNNKFNKNGFFICKKNNLTYENICFGKPFDFQYFLESVKGNRIIFDSGMYTGNNRNYSQFRASKTFWEELIYEVY